MFLMTAFRNGCLNGNFTFHGSRSSHTGSCSSHTGRSLPQAWFIQMKHTVQGGFLFLSEFIICSRLGDILSDLPVAGPQWGKIFTINPTWGDRLTSFMVGALMIRRGIGLPLQSFKASSFSRLRSSFATSDAVRLTDFLLFRLALLPRT